METRLKDLRKAAGFTSREAFAKEIGVNINTYKTWENGSVTINVQQACMLSSKLNCTLDELIGIEEPERVFDEREDRLLSLFRSLSEQGKCALLASAEGMSVAFCDAKE
mgnify:CR=1 FL=1